MYNHGFTRIKNFNDIDVQPLKRQKKVYERHRNKTKSATDKLNTWDTEVNLERNIDEQIERVLAKMQIRAEAVQKGTKWQKNVEL